MIINMQLIISDNQKQLWWYGNIQMNVNKIFKYQQNIYMSRQIFKIAFE